MAGRPAARFGDITAHGGSIVGCEPRVIIGGSPAARSGDAHTCAIATLGVAHVGGAVGLASTTVFIGGAPAARIGDLCPCCSVGMTYAESLTAMPIDLTGASANRTTTFTGEVGYDGMAEYQTTREIDADFDGDVDVVEFESGAGRLHHAWSFLGWGSETTLKQGYVETKYATGGPGASVEVGVEKKNYTISLGFGLVKARVETRLLAGEAQLGSPGAPAPHNTGGKLGVALIDAKVGVDLDARALLPQALLLSEFFDKSVVLSLDASGGVGRGGGFEIVSPFAMERDGRNGIGLKGIPFSRLGLELSGDIVLTWGDIEPPVDEVRQKAIVDAALARAALMGVPNIIVTGFPCVLVGG